MLRETFSRRSGCSARDRLHPRAVQWYRSVHGRSPDPTNKQHSIAADQQQKLRLTRAVSNTSACRASQGQVKPAMPCLPKSYHMAHQRPLRNKHDWHTYQTVQSPPPPSPHLSLRYACFMVVR